MPKAKEKELKTPNISRFSAPFEVSYQYLFFLLRMYLYNTRNAFALTGTWVRIPPSPPKIRFLLKAKTFFLCFSSLTPYPTNVIIFLIERITLFPL